MNLSEAGIRGSRLKKLDADFFGSRDRSFSAVVARHAIIRAGGQHMATWIFQGNPDRFDLDGYLAAGLPRISWTLKRYVDRMAVGDEVYLWRSAGSGREKEGAEAGVFASARIDSPPWDGPDHAEARPFWRTTGGAESVETRVWLVVEKVADKNGVIRRNWLAEDPVCRELLIIKQAAGTNYPVPDVGDAQNPPLFGEDRR